MDSIWLPLLRIIICLPVVLLLMVLILKYGISNRMLQPQASNMAVVERIALTPKTGLFIIKVEDKYLLIGVAENGIVLLKELTDYKEGQKQEMSSFLDIMKKAVWRRGGHE